MNSIVTAKKGVGHWGSDLPEAPDLLGCSWYYNWGPRPFANTRSLKAEFVPMVWSAAHVNEDDLAFIRDGAFSTLLGFNEPDGRGQANMSVEESVTLWPKLEETGLRLGSPAPTTGAPWLDNFMDVAARSGLRVDFLCLHWYGDITKPDPVQDLLDYLTQYWEKYGLPIWLTEFSGADFHYHLRKTTVENNAHFAHEAIQMLEALDFVERYAWFAPLVPSTDQFYPTVALLEPGGTLTAVGRAWRSAPQLADSRA